MVKVEQDKANTDIVTVEAEEVVEESPLLVAQRYLNIFRQIHIFNAAKKAEFDNELLNLPEKIKRLLINIPGGRILLEHILELEEKNNYSTQLTKTLIAQKKQQDPLELIHASNAQALSPVTSEVKLGSDFANTLAKSLATALSSNVLPQPIISGRQPVVTTDANGKQVNTQNNAAATTVNNIHLDYSIFQNLADAIRENSKVQIEEMRIFSKTLTDAILGREQAESSHENNKQNKNKTQTVSVVNKTIDSSTSQSSVQKTSLSIPADTAPSVKPKKPNKPKDPLLQAQSVISRIGLNVKPISLSAEEPASTISIMPKSEPKPSPSYKEFELDENLNLQPSVADNNSSEEEWEYVDEYGNPVSADDDAEWEYVDEYGNPVSLDDDSEWEYVEEEIPQESPKPQETVIEKIIISDPYSKTKEETKKEIIKEQPKEENTPKEDFVIKEKPTEKTEEKVVAETPKVDLSNPVSLQSKDVEKKEEKSGGIFSSLFKKKPEVKVETSETPKQEEIKPQEEKKDSADDILAKAFASAPTETPKEEIKPQEEKKDSADDILAKAFASAPAETPKEEIMPQEEKEGSADDILAKAFGSAPTETPNEEIKPRMGGILAEAYQEVEREQKNLSSKDLLAQAFKSKPQTTKELLNSALNQKQTESLEDKAEDELANAFKKQEEKPADDILARAFGSAPAETPKEEEKPADDALMQAFSAPKGQEEKQKEKPNYDPEFEALLKAFQS